jgi:hypothetical protein
MVAAQANDEELIAGCDVLEGMARCGTYMVDDHTRAGTLQLALALEDVGMKEESERQHGKNNGSKPWRLTGAALRA